MKLLTPAAIDPAHYRNLVFAARAGVAALSSNSQVPSRDLLNVTQSLCEIEAAISKGTESEPPAAPAGAP